MTLQPLLRKSKQKKKSKIKLNAAQRNQLKLEKKLHNKVLSTFKNMQFEYINSNGVHLAFDGQIGEMDNIFLFENIILIIEETTSYDRDHIRKKHIYFEKILNDKDRFIEWLKKDYRSVIEKFEEYSTALYKIHYLYVVDSSIEYDVIDAFRNLYFVEKTTLEYFKFISSCIKYTARLELYRFLKLNNTDVGHSTSSRTGKEIETAILIPESGSGFPEGVQVLTFVMQAEELMECSYVLRKDSWDSSMGVYQRLIDKKRIDAIRTFLAKKRRTFIDSVIVSLPDEITFHAYDSNSGTRKSVDIWGNTNFANITMSIPFSYNSIGIIDGQHRILSHYRGNDSAEKSISKLRRIRHLFVTGLYFNRDKFNPIDRRRFESELFLQINNEQKRVRPALLQYIQSLNEPYSAIGIANGVIEYLNRSKPFVGLLNTSPLAKGGIPTPTILRYGLLHLVAIDENTINLHTYWLESKGRRADLNDDPNEYYTYCGKAIALFFSAVKQANLNEWNDKKIKDSKILSVTSIVGFVRAYRKSLELFNGPQGFEFYLNRISRLKVTYGNYKSSHWNDLADEIEKQCWIDN